VFESETHFHKWGIVQKIEPNDFQIHSHFRSYIHVRVSNVQSLNFFKKNSKLGLQNTIRKILKYRCLNCLHIIHLDLKCMSYDRKKGQSQFDFRSQIPLEQWSNHLQLGCAYTIGKMILKAIRYFFHVPKRLDLEKI
jgi:hypothetical protein